MNTERELLLRTWYEKRLELEAFEEAIDTLTGSPAVAVLLKELQRSAIETSEALKALENFGIDSEETALLEALKTA